MNCVGLTDGYRELYIEFRESFCTKDNWECQKNTRQHCKYLIKHFNHESQGASGKSLKGKPALPHFSL